MSFNAALALQEEPLMAKAVYAGRVIAETAYPLEFEGRLYFPIECIDPTVLRPSETTTVCSLKGTAHYYDLMVDGVLIPDAAWTYPEPKAGAAHVANHFAFDDEVETIR